MTPFGKLVFSVIFGVPIVIALVVFFSPPAAVPVDTTPAPEVLTPIEPPNLALDLADDELVGVVLMPSFEKNDTAEIFGKTLCDIKARAYIILRKDTSRALTDAVQNAYAVACGEKAVQLLVALDAEPSLMQYRLPSVKVPLTNTLTSSTSIISTATTIADALKERGVLINFAPVYDVNTNTAIIGDRSFGSDTKVVAERANLFAETLRSQGIIAAAKHFPGHGLAVGDTHVTAESVPGTLAELPAFESAIDSGIPLMMVGHMSVDGGEWDTGGLPSTLSKRIMTDLLKTRLGYTGVVITDSMAMRALNEQNDRSVRALVAGADIVLIPPDPRAAHARILELMQSDAEFKARVRDAARKVLQLYGEYTTQTL